MYFPDLYEEQIFVGRTQGLSKARTILVKVAWLDEGKPYTKGECPQVVIDTLNHIKPSVGTKGWHDCPFCKKATSSRQYRIPWKDNLIFDVPEMIIHYIEKHNYLPPT